MKYSIIICLLIIASCGKDSERFNPTAQDRVKVIHGTELWDKEFGLDYGMYTEDQEDEAYILEVDEGIIEKFGDAFHRTMEDRFRKISGVITVEETSGGVFMIQYPGDPKVLWHEIKSVISSGITSR